MAPSRFSVAIKSVAITLIFATAGSCFAQNYGAQAGIATQNVVQLSASGTVDAAQDLLTMALGTTREGPDAAQVQSQLKAALDVALGEAKKSALPDQMEVRTGQFSLAPRYGRDGKIMGWLGSAELVLEGRDFARISTTAGKLQGLSVGSVAFGLSRELRAKTEAQAQALAIERFKAKASEIAHAFGFGGYGLREVTLASQEPGGGPRPRMMAMSASLASADSAVPVEAGKSAVVVTVSGSVQLK